jgi:hypothetical protein
VVNAFAFPIPAMSRDDGDRGDPWGIPLVFGFVFLRVSVSPWWMFGFAFPIPAMSCIARHPSAPVFHPNSSQAIPASSVPIPP